MLEKPLIFAIVYVQLNIGLTPWRQGYGIKSNDNTEPRVQPLVISRIWKRIWDRKVRLERGFVFYKLNFL